MNGALAFVDTSDCTMMNIAEHYMASDVEWDPTGRYVVTSVSWWSHKVITAPSLKKYTFSASPYLIDGNSYWFYSTVGGQRILAVDIPGSSTSEEQQGPLLSATLETKTSYPAQRRTDQGTVLSINTV